MLLRVIELVQDEKLRLEIVQLLLDNPHIDVNAEDYVSR